MEKHGLYSNGSAGSASLLKCVRHEDAKPEGPKSPFLVGVLEGEGVGPEVVGSVIDILNAVSQVSEVEFATEFGGAIGRASEEICGRPLSEDVVAFCQSILDRGGAILAGPGGGRFVYDLRRQFNLYCKIVPIRPEPGLAASRHLPGDDPVGSIVLVRENVGGVYQGTWELQETKSGKKAVHGFSYDEPQVRDILLAGARVAAARRGAMSVVWKESGLPSVGELWRDCALEVASGIGVKCTMIDVDYAAYWLLTQASSGDVIVAPNLFGDILGDLGAVYPGSRGLTYSGNFDHAGHAVYQTNHGAAYDLQGTDRANPVGQIFSAAMMLRESFGLSAEADLIERGVRAVWEDGWRTDDLAETGCTVVGTSEITRLICRQVAEAAVPQSVR